MARAAMFAQHSVTDARGKIEGFPVAIAEAMATGLPIVSTRHSGIPEHVHDGISGHLVAEHDVGAMAGAMARLLADPGGGRRHGQGRAGLGARASRPARRLRPAARDPRDRAGRRRGAGNAGAGRGGRRMSARMNPR